jgi:hypothetical protein
MRVCKTALSVIDRNGLRDPLNEPFREVVRFLLHDASSVHWKIRAGPLQLLLKLVVDCANYPGVSPAHVKRPTEFTDRLTRTSARKLGQMRLRSSPFASDKHGEETASTKHRYRMRPERVRERYHDPEQHGPRDRQRVQRSATRRPWHHPRRDPHSH